MRRVPKRPEHKHAVKGYDLELAVLEAMRPHPAYTFSLPEIAEVCGVNHSAIRHIEQNALRKLRPLLEREREILECLA